MQQICALAIILLLVGDEKLKSPPLSIPVPEVDQLQWSNLRLDAQARRAQAETLRLQADQLDAKANEKLNELKKVLVGPDADHYDFELTKEGKMQLVRRPDPKPKENK